MFKFFLKQNLKFIKLMTFLMMLEIFFIIKYNHKKQYLLLFVI